MTPRVCLEVWGADPVALVAVAQHAEAVGLDGVYLGESPTALNAEAWVTLGAVAQATRRIRLGPVIANLLPDYRSPVLLAKQGAALAALSGGRFDFRTGVGADRAAGSAWWSPAGVRYPDYADRLHETDRQLGQLRALWSGASISLGNRPFRLDLSHPAIDVTVAATTSRALELADRHGDRWETSFATADEWRERALAAPSNRANSLEVDAFVGSASDPDLVWRRAARDRANEDLDLLRSRALTGSPALVARQIAAYGEVGVEQLVVALHDPLDLDAIARLGEAVGRVS